MHKYTIVLEKANGNYSAYCPDLLGCIATGSTIEETAKRMKAAIKLHLEGLKAEGLDIPEAVTTVISVEIAV
jgi:predicted RNase H-like HicB family nuclease